MRIVSLAKAKAKLSEILDRVEKGEEVIITRRGKEIAKFVAITRKPLPFTSHADFRASLPAAKIKSAELVRRLRNESRY